MFTEDMTAFFNQSEFAVSATFTVSGGGSVSASVLFDAQTQDIFGDAALSDEYTITYPSTALPGLRSGDLGTVGGVQYRVRDVRLKSDGALVTAKLSKVV